MEDLKQDFIKTVLSLKEIPQSPKWHPEGDTLEHVKFIMYGLTFFENDAASVLSVQEAEFLMWVALFHDLGKIDTFSVDDNGIPHAYGHEKYAKSYIDKYEDIIPSFIDIDKLKKFCYFHMKAHQYMGTQMRETKKEAFRDQFDDRDFFLLMTFESCDSANVMYQRLRRTPEHLSIGYLEPVEFYEAIRSEVPWSSEEDFVSLLKLMMSKN